MYSTLFSYAYVTLYKVKIMHAIYCPTLLTCYRNFLMLFVNIRFLIAVNYFIKQVYLALLHCSSIVRT